MKEQEFFKYSNPLEYLRIFFRRKWLLVTPIFIGLVLGITACFVLPPTYESSTTILVEEEKIINPLIENLAVSTTAAQRIQRIREVILGWNSLVELTKKLNLAKEMQNPSQFEKLIFDLRKNIQVQMREPNIIKISYLGKEPQETQLVAKALTDLLIEKNMQSQTKETDVAINFIKEQLAIYKRKIKESEISSLEDQLKGLLVDSTEQHPLVKELRQKATIAKRELESGEYEVATSEQPITDAARQALKKELDKIIEKETKIPSGSVAFAKETEHDSNTAIYKLLLMDKVDSSLARDMSVNETIYNMLLQRLETAKITQRLEISKEGTRYTVLEPPRLPLRPIKPNKLQIIFLGIFLGGFSGTGLVFGREFMDHSFLDVEDAKQNLELPVLGAISRITTQEQIKKERNKRIALIIAFLIFGALIIMAAMSFSFFKVR